MARAGTCLRCGFISRYEGSGDEDKDLAIAANLANTHSMHCQNGRECESGHVNKVSAGVADRHVCPDCMAVVNDAGEVVPASTATLQQVAVVNPPSGEEQ